MVHLWIQEFLSTNKKELKASKQYQVSQKQLQRNITVTEKYLTRFVEIHLVI